ncbi:hypothetical protein [Paenibacillus sp. PL91]|uniref:hypothetical protein n=1 Tax=Paenibacillus sp. PL91 TaxID=2729538 RepID=UPI00145E7FB8|nr:hypothetical protein [Paenibacillus sp. PL91]MBC9203755.1 hypothetical protein [Paenibacillus sp. PL91]
MAKWGNLEGGRHKMTTEIKTIRPTHLEFDTEEEMNNFINYATNTKKTSGPGLDRLRHLMKTHKRAPEKK